MRFVRLSFRLSYNSENLLSERNHLRITSSPKGTQCLKIVYGFEKIRLSLSIVPDQRHPFTRHLQILIFEISEVPYRELAEIHG